MKYGEREFGAEKRNARRPKFAVKILRLHDAGKLLDDCLRDAPVVLAWLQAHPGEQINMQKTPDGLKRYLDISRVGMRGTTLVETANVKSVVARPLADADGAGRALGLDAFAARASGVAPSFANAARPAAALSWFQIGCVAVIASPQ